MATKRKTVPPKDYDADREQRVMDGLLATIGDSYIKKNLPNEDVLKCLDEREKIEGSLVEFLAALDAGQFDRFDSSEFDKRWREFLLLNISHANCDLIISGLKKSKAQRLIVQGWACFYQESAEIRFRFGPPLDGGEAVTVVMVFQDALWYPTSYIEVALWRHPAICKVVGEAQPHNWRERVLNRLTWAASLSDPRESSQRLRELSDTISRMLHLSTDSDCAEEPWLAAAAESDSFWAILAHAVDFGIHQNARRLFMDGKLLGAAQQSALNDKVEKLSWWLIIEEAIREIFATTGSVPSPLDLRKMFGVKAEPGSTREILDFVDKRFSLSGNITWGLFQKYAKRAGKIWSDHRTD